MWPWAPATHGASASAGRVCASRSSDRFWPRHRPKGRLREPSWSGWHNSDWEHPCGEGPVRFSASTIERWYYRARAAHQDPVRALRARPRTDAGRVRAMSAALIAALREQYRDHPSWSAQLHHDNLQVACRCRPVSRADAVVRDADPGDALAGAGVPASTPTIAPRARASSGRVTRGAELRGVAQSRPVAQRTITIMRSAGC